MINAIIYTSNTGSAAQYAKLLSEKIGLPVYSLKNASKVLSREAEIIYIGWIAASVVKGYAKAAKRYHIRAVCAVGMGQTGTQTESVRNKTVVPVNVPLFTLQGNFDVKKLHGIYRPMMAIMVKITGKCLAAKKDRTPEEDDMLNMMLHGGERVRQEHLCAVLNWYNVQK